MDKVSGLRIAVLQEADNIFRIIGHQEVKAFLVQYFLLAFQDLHDPGYKIIQVLKSKGACDKVSEKGFRQPENRAASIIFIPEFTIPGQQVGLSDLGNNDGKIVLVDIGVVGINYIFNTVGQSPEDIQVLGIGEPFNAERTGKKPQVCFQSSACDTVNFQSPQIKVQTLYDPDKCCPGDK